MGGLSRKYTVIDKITGSDNIENLVIDSGNFLFSSPKPRSLNTQAIHKANGIAEIYREMNYDAVNMGPSDLAAGIGYLKNLDFLPWVCSNFYDNSGKPIFKKYIIKSKSKIRYGIIGLSTQSPIPSKEFNYKPWQAILPAIIQELHEKVDCIILLSSLNDKENKDIVQNFPEIRLLFSSLSTSGNKSPQIVNKAVLTQTANRGKYLGQLYLVNPGLHDWTEPSAHQKTSKENMRKTIEYRLSRINFLMSQNNNNTNILSTLEKQKHSLLRQLKDLKTNKTDERGAEKSTFRSTFTPLTQNIVENRKISDLIRKIKADVKNSAN